MILSRSTYADGSLHSHTYRQLPLIPAEEFLEKHPEHVGDDEKMLMFARINHELSEREALEQQRQVLLKKKQTLIAENKKRKDDLASLDQDLEKFIDVCCYPCSFLSINKTEWLLTSCRPRNQYRRSLRSNIEL